DVQGNVDSFLLRSGPADAPALFDFHHLRIAFEPVWHELFDTRVCDKAYQLYSKYAEAGVDPNSYLTGPLASTISLGSLPLVLGSILKDAQTSSGIPLHHWVTQAFDITDQEWGALQPDERRDLIILAAQVLGVDNAAAKNDALAADLNIQPSFSRDVYGFETL